MTVFFPIGTGTNAVNGKLTVGITDPGQAQVKDIVVRKLK
jgi:glycine cleavage system H lipoate-binding protein